MQTQSFSDADLFRVVLGDVVDRYSVDQLWSFVVPQLPTVNHVEESAHLPYTIGVMEKLQACLEIASRSLLRDLFRQEEFSSPRDSEKFLIAKYTNSTREVFSVLFLNNQHKLIAHEEIFLGTISSCEIHVREIAKACLRYNAASVILSHNHPSGLPDPSQADIVVTRQTTEALRLIDVKVLDHIIVAGNQALSMADKRLL